MRDNTTQDWLVLQGQEKNGWTAIRFKRLLHTCDSMDVPIKVRRKACILYFNSLLLLKSGTNILIFAYGLVNLDSNRPEVDITYHGIRRNSRMLPLRSYADPRADEKFLGLDTFEFRLDNVCVS